MKAINYSAVSLAVLSAMGVANAAGLDRSGQDVSAFLQDGTYAEVVYTYIDADVSGYDSASNTGASSSVSTYTKGAATGDVAEAYDFFRYGVKADINDTFSVGVLYDEPFGAAVEYTGDSNFVSQGGNATVSELTGGRVTNLATANVAQLSQAFAGIQQLADGIQAATAAGDAATAAVLNAQLQTATGRVLQATGTTSLPEAQAAAEQLGRAAGLANIAEATAGQGTNVEIRTNNVTALLGAKLGANKNFQIYGGPAAQRLTGEVHLRGTAYQGSTGYNAKISPDQAYGWVAGIAYSKPEIALKAALTYRSEIEHDTTIAEFMPGLALRNRATTTTQPFSVTLPESYNLDFQTGVNPTTLLTAKVRYVPWSDFTIAPPHYGFGTTFITDNGESLPIASYTKDQWSVELGLGKKLSDKLSISGNVGWDSGAGNPTSTLGPIEGYYSVGLGAKYNITPNWSVSAGGKYLMFGDAHAQLPDSQIAGNFEDNDGYIVGVKLAYQDK